MPLNPPTVVQLIDDGPTHRSPVHLDIAWTLVAGAIDYVLELSDETGGGVLQVATTPPYRFNGLKANRSYRITVRARDGADLSTPSLPLDACTALPEPIPPTLFAINSIGAPGFFMAWDQSPLLIDTTHPIHVVLLQVSQDDSRLTILDTTELSGNEFSVTMGGSTRIVLMMYSLHPLAPNGRNVSPETAPILVTVVGQILGAGLAAGEGYQAELRRQTIIKTIAG